MSEIISNWVKENSQDDGVLAVGVQYPGRSAFVWSNSDEFPPAALEGALQCMADTFQVIGANRFPISRLRWIYGNAFVHAAARTDGICMGIIARKEPPTLDTDRVERLIAEFENLRA